MKKVYLVTDAYDTGDAWEPWGEFNVALVGIFTSLELAKQKARESLDSQEPQKFTHVDGVWNLGTIQIQEVELDKLAMDKTGNVKLLGSYQYEIDDLYDDPMDI